MSILQRENSFKGVIIAASPNVTDYALSLNLTVITKVESNPYGLPFLNSIVNSSKSLFNASFYGYMNSDILLNPLIIKEMTLIKEAIDNGLLVPPVIMVFGVIVVDDRIKGWKYQHS